MNIKTAVSKMSNDELIDILRVVICLNPQELQTFQDELLAFSYGMSVEELRAIRELEEENERLRIKMYKDAIRERMKEKLNDRK